MTESYKDLYNDPNQSMIGAQGATPTITLSSSSTSYDSIVTLSGLNGPSGPTNTICTTTNTGSFNLSPDTIVLGSTDDWYASRNDALTVNGDIKFNGRSLTEIIDKFEKRLAIMRPNPELEAKWDRLKELGEAYRALERDILEKEKIVDILKK